MIIDNLTSTEVYVERPILATIIGNSTTNNNGTLEIDSFGNSLLSTIDSGDTPLYRLDKYIGDDSLMLYNPTTKHIQLAKEGDILNIDIDFERGTKYYIGAKILKSTSKTGNTFNVELNGLTPLKVFLDGREIKNYSSSLNNLTISGSDVSLLDIFSEIVVYAFKTTVIESEDNLFEIQYYQYETIWEHDSFLDGSYFENIRGNAVMCFDSVSINQNLTKTTYRGGFRYSTETRINSIDNVADFNIFDASELIDMIQWAGNVEFRMIFSNTSFGRIVLLNNCKIDNGISLIYDKAKNTKKFNLSCGNYIDIRYASPSLYGKGKYGKGQYGSGTYVVNSHRRGE